MQTYLFQITQLTVNHFKLIMSLLTIPFISLKVKQMIRVSLNIFNISYFFSHFQMLSIFVPILILFVNTMFGPTRHRNTNWNQRQNVILAANFQSVLVRGNTCSDHSSSRFLKCCSSVSSQMQCGDGINSNFVQHICIYKDLVKNVVKLQKSLK